MTEPAPPPVPTLREPRWGIADAAVGWLVAESAALLGAGIVLGATGHGDPMPIHQEVLDQVASATGTVAATADFTPLWVVALLQAFLWVGLLGAPLYATRVKGNGPVADLGLRFRPVDVPLGIAVGLVSQVVFTLASYPWLKVLGRDMSDLDQPARDLADKATSPVGILLLVLIVVIGAPIVEELFFRGLLQRAAERRWGPVVAVAVSSVVFGATHFELLQLPALVGFGVVLGVLALRTGRLGPGIFAHLSFNAATVIALLVKA